MGKFLIFSRIKLKFRFWLYKKHWHTLWKFQLEIASNQKVIAEKPLTNLHEMNSNVKQHWSFLIKFKLIFCRKSSAYLYIIQTLWSHSFLIYILALGKFSCKIKTNLALLQYIGIWITPFIMITYKIPIRNKRYFLLWKQLTCIILPFSLPNKLLPFEISHLQSASMVSKLIKMLSECIAAWIRMRCGVTQRLIHIQAVCTWHFGCGWRAQG